MNEHTMIKLHMMDGDDDDGDDDDDDDDDHLHMVGGERGVWTKKRRHPLA